MAKNLNKRITIILTKKNGKTNTLHTKDKTRRIIGILKAEKYQKVYLRVSYGLKKDVDGKMSEFYNEGYYYNPEDAITALQDFWKEE